MGKKERFRERVDDIYVTLVGNRINLVSRAVTGASMVGTIVQGAHSEYAPVFGVSLIGLVISEVITLCGYNTLEFYRRTREHIMEFGCLREEVVRTFVPRTREERIWNYCAIQGVRLAARRYNESGVFEKVFSI